MSDILSPILGGGAPNLAVSNAFCDSAALRISTFCVADKASGSKGTL